MASSSSKAAAAKEEYEAELEKPFGLRFYKGSDGGTYIDAIAPGGSADKTKLFTPGDRVIATSAVFGNEMWPAAEYGRTMYTVRQRIGTLAIKMEKRYGLSYPELWIMSWDLSDDCLAYAGTTYSDFASSLIVSWNWS
jgi:hypothetical protein